MYEEVSLYSRLYEFYTEEVSSMLRDILTMSAELTHDDTLDHLVIDYLSSVTEDDDISDIGHRVKNIIIEHVVTEIINKEYGMILDRQQDISLSFITGLLSFYSNLDKYNSVITPEIQNILHNDSIDNELKIGSIVALYKETYYPYDAYMIIDIVPQVVMYRYKEIIDDLVDSSSLAIEAATMFLKKLIKLDEQLLTTYMFRYISRNDSYDLTDTQAYALLDHYYKEYELTSSELAKELVVVAVLLDKPYSEMIDMIDSLYNTMESSSLVSYLSDKLED